MLLAKHAQFCALLLLLCFRKHLHKLFYIQFLFQFIYSHCGTTIWGESTISYSRHVHCSYLNNNTSSLITQAFERHSITPLSTASVTATLTQDHMSCTEYTLLKNVLKLVTVCNYAEWENVWIDRWKNGNECGLRRRGTSQSLNEWELEGIAEGIPLSLKRDWRAKQIDRLREREFRVWKAVLTLRILLIFVEWNKK